MDASSVPKNDGAKVYKILEYLRKVPMHKAVSVVDIFKHTGVVRGQHDLALKRGIECGADGVTGFGHFIH